MLHLDEPRKLQFFKTLHLPLLYELLSYEHFGKMLIDPLAGLIFRSDVLSQQKICVNKT